MTDRFASLVLPKRHPNRSDRPCDDRVLCLVQGGAAAFLVADGATGSGDGWKAAGIVADLFEAEVWSDPTPSGIAALLARADGAVAAACRGDADTTAVALVVRGLDVAGASAGDSEAYAVTGEASLPLTWAQARKPRLGSGARPVPFSATASPGDRLVVATDGLWQQAPMGAILSAIRAPADAGGMVANLAGLLAERHPSGLPDDFGCVAIAF